MQTEYSADGFGFAPVEKRAVVAGFDGGRMTSDAGALLLGTTDRAIGLVPRPRARKRMAFVSASIAPSYTDLINC
jgi:hypothetical protein